MSNEDFIKQHLNEDPLSLALKKAPEGIDLPWCLMQIEGYGLAKKKLPTLATIDGIWFPPRLSLEQCSSEATAKYKKKIVERLKISSLTDLTGGYGIDFSYMAQDVEHPIYVEQQDVLCQSARHNFPLMGLQNAEIINSTCEEFWQRQCVETKNVSHLTKMIFLDPARRNKQGGKVFSISECTPDVTLLQDSFLDNADYVLLKLSPMLDIAQALRQLHNVVEVHVVSVKGECKELLFLMARDSDKAITYHCVNIETDDNDFITSPTQASPQLASSEQVKAGAILLEPNASIMKAGLQNAFSVHYGLLKLHPMSNLFILTSGLSTLHSTLNHLPARCFIIEDVTDFQKANLKAFMNNSALTKANLTIRNFPSTVEDLRKRLKLKEGGDTYIFATTLADNSHVLIRCKKK